MPRPADPCEIRDTKNIGILALELEVPETTREQQCDAAGFVARRARALGWTRDEHEQVLLALFQPVRSSIPAPDQMQEA